MNIVLDEAVEEKSGGEKARLGMVVRSTNISRNHFLSSLLIMSLGHSW